jgi:PAS domain S-box-containing protein
MILDHEGVVRFASRADLVDSKLSPEEEGTCLTCHSLKPEERKRDVLLDGGAALRTVLPLENRPECQNCHDSKKRLNGILILDVSLAEAQAQLRHDTAWIVAGTVGLAVLLLGGMALVLRQLVLVRLARLGRTARAIAGGELEQRAVVDGNDMITTVAAEFNNMAASVSRLINEVRDQEAQLRSVLNSVDDGLVVLDDAYRVVAANHSFCKRFGVPPETLRGRRCVDAVHCMLDCTRAGTDCPTARCMTSGELQRAVFRVGSEDRDTEVVEEIYSSPIFDDDGQVVQVVEVWRDISARVKEEERLAEVERLVSLGALASGFSHEMNTPLASMLICAEAVLGRIDDPGSERDAETMLSAIRDYADIIRKEVLRCRKITEQFLRFSRGIPPSVEPIDLTPSPAQSSASSSKSRISPSITPMSRMRTMRRLKTWSLYSPGRTSIAQAPVAGAPPDLLHLRSKDAARGPLNQARATAGASSSGSRIGVVFSGYRPSIGA